MRRLFTHVGRSIVAVSFVVGTTTGVTHAQTSFRFIDAFSGDNASDTQTAPTISAITDTATGENVPTSAISFTVGDAETPAASLTLSGGSSNTTLVPNGNIVFGGAGANRTVTVTPAANQHGPSTITVTVSDGTMSASRSFLLIVNPVKLCLPAAVGVPGNSGPPDWFTAGQDVNSRAYTPYDPRWRGAMSIDHGFGSVSQAEFRGLHDVQGGTTRFLFSWRIKTTPDVVLDATSFFVGIAPLSANAAADKTNARIYRFRLKQNSTVGDADPAPNVERLEMLAQPSEVGAVKYFEVTEYLFNNGTWGTGAPPSWLPEMRIWIRNASDTVNVPDITGGVIAPMQNEWALHARIPSSAITGLAPGSFRMWHYAQLGSNYNMATPATILYTWPRTQASPTDYVYRVVSAQNTFPEPATWGEFSTGGGCAGITLTTADIGTMNATSQSYIDITGPNTFFAKPTHKNPTTVNSPAVPANVLRATFRFANWGTQVGGETATSWVSPAPLTNVLDTGGIAAHPGTPASDPQGNITAPWNLSGDPLWSCQFTGSTGVTDRNGNFIPAHPSCAVGPATRMLHQCMLVELTGPGVNFLNSSAFRNMDFVNASTFEREAEVSVVGLSGAAGGQRDVYLYVDTLNMPAFSSGTPVDPRGQTPPSQRAAVAPSQQPQPPSMPTSGAVPMMVVHAYHDSGVDIEMDFGKTRLLIPQTSYGYIVQHAGELEGWTVQTLGAQPIPGSRTHFKVPVPNNGAVRIRQVIEAVEPKQFGVGINFGVAIPHNTFGSTHDSGFAIGADLEVRVAPRLAMVGTYMWTQFDEPSTGSATDLSRLSAAAKFYFSDSRIRPFAIGGMGAYMFDPGSTRFGVNMGGGVQGLITHTFALEGSYQFHAVSNNTPSTSYSEILGTLRIRF